MQNDYTNEALWEGSEDWDFYEWFSALNEHIHDVDLVKITKEALYDSIEDPMVSFF